MSTSDDDIYAWCTQMYPDAVYRNEMDDFSHEQPFSLRPAFYGRRLGDMYILRILRYLARGPYGRRPGEYRYKHQLHSSSLGYLYSLVARL